jgi:hypothetical protein
MADLPIWQLSELTSPALVDLLLAVDSPGGSPATKKLALSDFLSALALSNVVVQVKALGSSGTYTPTSGMKKVLGIAVGGGAAGGNASATDSASGGGGGGGTVIRLMTAAQIGSSKSYAVANDSITGGNSTTLDTAGALMNAGGGSAGTQGAGFSVVGVSVAGGAGGSASNGDINIPGQDGQRGIIYSGTKGWGGCGGSSAFGFGGEGANGAAGGNGKVYGGGGAGGHAATTSDRNGGFGAGGILYLIEFI